MEVKLFRPYVSWRAIWEVTKVLWKGRQLAEGPNVKKFEYEFARTFGVTNVVAVNSGTSALELAYDLAGIKAGDEVITPVLTCTATNIPLIRRGAHIIFADIDYDLNISIEDIRRKITPRTKALVFVHFGGNNRGLQECLSITREANIPLIEDAAQAVGTDYWGHADFTAVSLQAIKTLTAGDGGFLLCARREDAAKAKRLRWFGYDRDLKQQRGDTDLVEAGYKYHMNDITAALGLGNLRSIGPVIRHQEALGAIYASYGLLPLGWLTVGFRSYYGRLKQEYAHNGIEIGQYHYRNDKYTLFKEFKNSCPIMDELEDKYFFVPNHYGVTKKQAHKIGRIFESYRPT